jgi:uncharacterized membrane-anchored protein
MNNNFLTKKSLKAAFIVIVVLQCMVLGAMIGQRKQLLNNGEPVILKCEPVDPRSLFSGDYVELRYEISTLSRKLLLEKDVEETALKRNAIVYVALDKHENDTYWYARAVSEDLGILKEKYPVVIRGKTNQRISKYSKNLFIRYGVENYFVPQFKGVEIENNIGDVSVEVSVTDSGESGIIRLFINDKEVTFY